MAAAIDSLDTEIQFQKHWAICSLGHRQCHLWGTGNLSIILNAMIYWPVKNKLFPASKTPSPPEPHGTLRKITLTAGNISPQRVSAQPCRGARYGSSGCTDPLSQHRVYSFGRILYSVSKHTVTRFCVFSFFYQVQSVLPVPARTCGLQKRIQSRVGREEV